MKANKFFAPSGIRVFRHAFVTDYFKKINLFSVPLFIIQADFRNVPALSTIFLAPLNNMLGIRN